MMSKKGCIQYIKKKKKHTLKFQLNPESITYSRKANYTSIESAGMSYPLTQYTGGTVREFSFDLLFFSTPQAEYKGATKNQVDNIITARTFLLGLMPPEKNKKSFTKPPTFWLEYGYFKKKCVMTSLEIKDEIIDGEGRARKTIFTIGVRQVGA